MGYRLFTDLDTEVYYVNEQLRKGRSLSRIALEDYNYKSESSLRKRLTRGSIYKRVGQQFVRQCQTDCDTRDSGKDAVDVRQNDRHLITSNNIEIIESTYSDEVEPVIVDERYNNLLNNYEILMNMIDEYKNGRIDRFNSKLVIELPTDSDSKFRATFRINKTVYEEFQEFANNNKQFTIKELISAALQEFVEKYK